MRVTKIGKSLGVALIGLGVTCTSAWAVAWEFDRLDRDGNGRINASELADSNLFADWDANDDGGLQYDEFERPDLFPAWDRDSDGAVEPDEFYFTTLTFYDMNASEALERYEFPEAGPFPTVRGPLAGEEPHEE